MNRFSKRDMLRTRAGRGHRRNRLCARLTPSTAQLKVNLLIRIAIDGNWKEIACTFELMNSPSAFTIPSFVSHYGTLPVQAIARQPDNLSHALHQSFRRQRLLPSRAQCA